MNCGFRVCYADKTYEFAQSKLQCSKEGEYRVETEDFSAVWRFEKANGGQFVTLTAENRAKEEIVSIYSLVLGDVRPGAEDRFAFWGNALDVEVRKSDEMGVGKEYGGDCVGYYASYADPGLAVAGLIPFTYGFRAGAVQGESGETTFFAKTMFPARTGSTYRAEKIWYSESVGVEELFDMYRSLLPRSSFDMPKLTGWNSWDYYLDNVRPEDVYENMAALKKTGLADELKYIVLDDGWQESWGGWTENEKFACGLGEVAARIRQEGFVPGIWMAPLGVKKGHPLMEEHLDWFLRDRSGGLLYDMSLYYLDPTRPEVQKKIAGEYHDLYEKGFRLFKIDYLSPVVKAGGFFQDGGSPYRALQDMIALIREASGEDVVILGCTLPLQCGADIAPSMRSGVDIHNHFSHVEWIAHQLSWATMYNNVTTRVDPDFIVVRGEDRKEPSVIVPPNAKESQKEVFDRRWRAGSFFNRVEARTWARLASIVGGNIFLSDRIAELGAEELDILKEALKIHSEDVRPVYLPEDFRLPSLWVSKEKALLINWDEVEREKKFSLDGVSHSEILPAHGSALYDRPAGAFAAGRQAGR